MTVVNRKWSAYAVCYGYITRLVNCHKLQSLCLYHCFNQVMLEFAIILDVTCGCQINDTIKAYVIFIESRSNTDNKLRVYFIHLVSVVVLF